MKRKLLSLLLALALLLTLLPQAAPAARAEDEPIYSGECGVQGDNLTWRFDPETGTLTIEGYGYMESYYEYGDIPWVGFQSEITAISLPKSLRSIGDMAFSMCPNLTEAPIPESVEYIGDNAFENCIGLTELTIPGSVSHIGFCAFVGCTGLTSLTIPGTVKYVYSQAFAFCEGLTELTIQEGVETIDWDAFEHCTGLRSVVLPGSLESINGFHDCTNLIEVTMGEGPYYIGYAAFQNCTGLAEVEIPASVQLISESAFQGCAGLTEVELPATVLTVHENAFADCENLSALSFLNPLCNIYYSCLAGSAAVTVYGYDNSTAESFAADCGYPFVSLGTVDFTGPCGDSLTWTYDPDDGVLTISGKGDMWDFWTEEEPYREIPWHAVAEAITELRLDRGLTSIGENAFRDCTGLTSVTIPEGVTAIRDYAFCDCYNLTTAVVPEGVTYFSGFAYCYGLTDVTVPKSVTVIGYKALCSCELLTRIEIPEGVTYIGGAAFRDCIALTEMTLPDTVTAVVSQAFCRCNGLTEMTFPASVAKVGYRVLAECPALRTVTFLNPVCYIDSSCLAESWNATVYGYSGSTAQVFAEDHGYPFVSLGDAEIGGRCGDELTWTFDTETGLLTVEGSGAMWDFGMFDENDNYIWIPWEPFRGRLTAVSLPEGLTYIGQSAFQNCCCLTEAVIPGSVETIGMYAFMKCDGLKKLALSEGVRRIGEYAFLYCSLLSAVTLPASLEKVGIDALYGCTALRQVVVRNPACLICASERPDTRGVWYGFETENTLGDPASTVVYGLHDPEKEEAELMQEIEDTPWGPTVYGYRYAESYAKTYGYTFYATNVFEDVKPGKFYEIPVAWAYGESITSGKDETHFAPGETCTRGQVVTFLWNAMGNPEPTITDCPFVDVKPGKYYYDAMLWALETGVTSGKDETHFAPNESCTRGQVVTFIWNAMGKPEPTGTDCPFVDVTPGKYYYNAMLWALENGITAGLDETHFGPNQTCTRGQVVTFLYNALS